MSVDEIDVHSAFLVKVHCLCRVLHCKSDYRCLYKPANMLDIFSDLARQCS